MPQSSALQPARNAVVDGDVEVAVFGMLVCVLPRDVEFEKLKIFKIGLFFLTSGLSVQ